KYLEKLDEEFNPPSKMGLLQYVNTFDEEAKKKAYERIQEVEHEAKQEMELQPGIITLNSSETVNHMIHDVIPKSLDGKKVLFDHVLTRDFGSIKPDPKPLFYIAEQLNIHPSQLVMVGDTLNDIECGRNAGSITVLLKGEHNDKAIDDAHFVVSQLDHIIELLNPDEP
ncbi:hypothetical protein BB560_003134, partial [Smittium megazygosporum]